MAFVAISGNPELKAGDRVLLRYNVNFLGQNVQRKISDFLSEARADRGGLAAGHFQVEGATIDPTIGTLNVLVRVRGTPLVAIVLGLAIIAAAVFVVMQLRDAFLEVVSAVGSAVESVGSGVEATGQGLGVGLAVAGVVGAAFLLGFLDLR